MLLQLPVAFAFRGVLSLMWIIYFAKTLILPVYNVAEIWDKNEKKNTTPNNVIKIGIRKYWREFEWQKWNFHFEMLKYKRVIYWEGFTEQ